MKVLLPNIRECVRLHVAKVQVTQAFFNLVFCSCMLTGVTMMQAFGQVGPSITMYGRHPTAKISTGFLSRTLVMRDGVPYTRSLIVNGDEALAGPSAELSFSVYSASPNREPIGLRKGEGGAIDVVGKRLTTDVIDVKDIPTSGGGGVKWDRVNAVSGDTWLQLLGPSKFSVLHRENSDELVVSTSPRSLGLTVTIHYSIYAGQPAIRKWVEISNHGMKWLKIAHLRIEPWELSSAMRLVVPLTPSDDNVGSSLIARGIADQTHGIILGNEIPSALRMIAADGSMGYRDDLFEWVIGPGEHFISEAVFEYGYAGAVRKTISAVSTPLDRAVEGPFQRFLRRDVGLITDPDRVQAPLYSDWSTFGTEVDDALIRKLADIAAECGFRLFELDEGWQYGNLGTEPDTKKFPDFLATTQYIHSMGLSLGLWVSSYRTPGSKDFKAVPDGASRPEIRRMGGLGMSFASPWRHYYASDLARLSRQYGATYFKQDFSDIRFGDIAYGHESRTRKESLLRGLRGLLEAQDELRRLAPSVSPELTHEIYWGTPGAPCDLAALEHVQSFHVPPNDYSGTIQEAPKSEQKGNKAISADLARALLQGTLNARQRFYSYRGLPMYAIEYYAAAANNDGGSLTPKIQDRQVASWLMGAPTLYSGDLRTLTPSNIKRYHSRFDMLTRLEKTYGIYGYFEFSGVPSQPTDTGWEWWGKLNEKGFGAVVVLRGSAGASARAINIPWVQPRTRYSVHALLSGRDLGTFTGAALQRGDLKLGLRTYDQDLLELAPAHRVD